ncbi:MAG: PhnD/SsuA/transferrin family substrate-binding protein [Polyangiaceae bacterium]
MTARVVFGLVPQVGPSAGAHVDALLAWVGARASLEVARVEAPSYDALAERLEAGDVDLAWLPPLVFTRLVETGFAHEVATGDRGPGDSYVSVLVARAGATWRRAAELSGVSVAWVDPLSASGYVVPRLRMVHAGVDLDRAFASERFTGSHAGVLRAVRDGVVDVGATFVGFGRGGVLARGAFDDAGVSADDFVVVDSFGGLPPDVIAARAALPKQVKVAFADALVAAADDADAREHLVAFGVNRFDRRPVMGHDALAAEVRAARDSGKTIAAAAFLEPPDDSDAT